MLGLRAGDCRTVLKGNWHGKATRIAQRLAAIGVETFFPGLCCGCGRLFRLPRRNVHALSFEQWMNRFLCAQCVEAFQAVKSPLCLCCGQPFAAAHGPDHTCGQCQERPFHFSAARAAGLYEGGLQTVIQQLKYHGRDSLAQPLGRFLWQTLGRYWEPAQIDRVIPVPLHPRRLRQRGFNQAGVLVKEWPGLARRQGFQVPADWIDHGILRRQRHTQPQTGLGRKERVDNLRHAFQVNPRKTGSGLKNLRVLLVDDVMTTGTTADACTQSLLAAGAAEVRVLTLARAVADRR